MLKASVNGMEPRVAALDLRPKCYKRMRPPHTWFLASKLSEGQLSFTRHGKRLACWCYGHDECSRHPVFLLVS